MTGDIFEGESQVGGGDYQEEFASVSGYVRYPGIGCPWRVALGNAVLVGVGDCFVRVIVQDVNLAGNHLAVLGQTDGVDGDTFVLNLLSNVSGVGPGIAAIARRGRLTIGK